MYFLLVVCVHFSVFELLILLLSARKLDMKFFIESMSFPRCATHMFSYFQIRPNTLCTTISLSYFWSAIALSGIKCTRTIEALDPST